MIMYFFSSIFDTILTIMISFQVHFIPMSKVTYIKRLFLQRKLSVKSLESQTTCLYLPTPPPPNSCSLPHSPSTYTTHEITSCSLNPISPSPSSFPLKKFNLISLLLFYLYVSMHYTNPQTPSLLPLHGSSTPNKLPSLIRNDGLWI